MYMDDIKIFAPSLSSIKKSLSKLESTAKLIGLHFNPSKCAIATTEDPSSSSNVESESEASQSAFQSSGADDLHRESGHSEDDPLMQTGHSEKNVNESSPSSPESNSESLSESPSSSSQPSSTEDPFLYNGIPIFDSSVPNKYKYLGFTQVWVNQATNKVDIFTEARRRVRKLIHSHLTLHNIASLLRVYVSPLVRFLIQVLDVSFKELRTFDKFTRSLLKKTNKLPGKIADARVYSPINKGGLGFPSMEMEAFREILNLRLYLIKKNEKELKKYPIINTSSISAEEPSLRSLPRDSTVFPPRPPTALMGTLAAWAHKVASVTGKEDRVTLGRLNNRILSHHLYRNINFSPANQEPEKFKAHINEVINDFWANKWKESNKFHSPWNEVRKKDLLNNKLSTVWLLKPGLTRNQVKTNLLLSDGRGDLRGFLALTLHNVSPLCRHCKKSKEHIDHVLGACPKTPFDFRESRHDQVVSLVSNYIARSLGVKGRFQTHNKLQKLTKESLRSGNSDRRQDYEVEINVNRHFRSREMEVSVKPDIVVVDKKKKTVTICDVGIAAENLVDSTIDLKISKYAELVSYFNSIYPSFETKVIPVVLGHFGTVTKKSGYMLYSLRSALGVPRISSTFVAALAGWQRTILKSNLLIYDWHRKTTKEMTKNEEKNWKKEETVEGRRRNKSFKGAMDEYRSRWLAARGKQRSLESKIAKSEKEKNRGENLKFDFQGGGDGARSVNGDRRQDGARSVYEDRRRNGG